MARTAAEDIRLRGEPGARASSSTGASNPRELRVCRPDGSDKSESGSIATAKVAPLTPNVWHTLKWRLTEEGMQVSVDGKIVFEERKMYDLSESGADHGERGEERR